MSDYRGMWEDVQALRKPLQALRGLGVSSDMDWPKAMRAAASGDSVLIVDRWASCELSTKIGNGWLFIRTHRMSGLKSVPVNMVWFIGKPSEEVASTAILRTSGYKDRYFYLTESTV